MNCNDDANLKKSTLDDDVSVCFLVESRRCAASTPLCWCNCVVKVALGSAPKSDTAFLLIEVDMNKLLAEFIGTFWLVLGGCGSAVLAAAFPEHGIHFVGVSFAFGLTVLTMAYAVGHISGGHFNPAVTFGLWAGGRFATKDIVGYVVAQVVGAIAGAAVLYCIISGKSGFAGLATSGAGVFATNGYDELSPGGFSMMSALIAEFVMTAAFLFIIMGATHKDAPAGFAPIAIGLGLTLIHLISIPVTNTSVNPARSTGVSVIAAMFGNGASVGQLWLFWLAPIAGGIAGALLYRVSKCEKSAK